jgi:hypothetical protein
MTCQYGELAVPAAGRASGVEAPAAAAQLGAVVLPHASINFCPTKTL